MPTSSRFVRLGAPALLTGLLLGCPPKVDKIPPAKSSESAPVDSETPPGSEEVMKNTAPAAAKPDAPKAEEKPAAATQNEEDVKALADAGVQFTKNKEGLVTAADCKNAAVTDELAKHFAGLPALSVLSLENAQVTNAGLSFLEGTPQLKELNLRRCTNVDDAGLVALKYVPNLERLLLLYTRVTSAGLEQVAQLKKLRLLDLRGCMQVGDAGLAHLTGLSELIEIKLRSYSVTDAGMKSLGELKKLRGISLEDCGVGDAGMEALKPLKDLRSLNVMRTVVGDKGLAAFAEMALTELNLRDTAVTGSGLSALTSAKGTLKSLDVSEIRISNEGLAPIAEFTKLESLNLWNGSLNDEGIALLAPLTELKNINLESCREVTSDSADHLVKFTKLESINLAETGFDDAGLQILTGLKNLKNITVSRSGITDAGIAKFKEALPNCQVKQ
ncbi:leucine-rich repeat domain-containing protein [Planctomicrobium sp. SH527]|uniref:leucine-rich repeat domain-containing protein n=1 Tax=Planctomicrobium sp. SH527 TaxID=3448123 RepID=UPI003F5B7E9A